MSTTIIFLSGADAYRNREKLRALWRFTTPRLSRMWVVMRRAGQIQPDLLSWIYKRDEYLN